MTLGFTLHTFAKPMAQTVSIKRNAQTASHGAVIPSTPLDIPRVLLLSPVPPSSNYTGALMLNSMCRTLPVEKLSCFAVLSHGMDSEIHADWKEIPYMHRLKPPESHIRRLPHPLGVIESFIKEQSTANFVTSKLTDDLLRFAESTGAETIWCTLEGQTLIRLALELRRRLQLPMVAQVWDPPGWWLTDNNVDRFSRKKILADFAEILSHPKTTTAAASWAMAEQYSKEYSCNAIAVMPGIPTSWARTPAKRLNDNSTLTIGFAGQLYSKNEWNCLMKALESVEWIIEGRQVEVRVLGRIFRIDARGERNIRFFGWRSQQETIEILSDCDVLYCPYWFSPQFETESRLSFPSKLTSYLAAGRPVLFHGPKYASPSRFLLENNAALQCNRLNQQSVVEALQTLVSDSSLYQNLAANGSASFHSYLTEERTQSQFLKAIGC